MNSEKEENSINCPICNKLLRVELINKHVDECLSGGDVVDNNDKSVNTKKRKSEECQQGWGFLMSGKTKSETSNPMKSAKRCRLSDSTLAGEEKKVKVGLDETITIDDDPGDCVSKSKTLSNTRSNSKSNEISSNPHDTKQVTPSKTKTEIKPIAETNKDCNVNLSVPLAEQMRPQVLEEYIGQEKALGRNKLLTKLLQSDTVPSMILWGPPGCGKTTLGKIISRRCKTKAKFVQLSATSSGVNDVKKVVEAAKTDYKMFKKRTILFLDEIHRFNKLQQDSLLPHVEDGTITLIGATTENPSFQVNNALLSRCRVIVLDKLDSTAVLKILTTAVHRLGFHVQEDNGQMENQECFDHVVEKSGLEFLSVICDGDARVALNGLQISIQAQITKSQGTEESLNATNSCGSKVHVTTDDIKEGLQRSHVVYDRTGEEHYNMISALHKSMRGGDASAALYWMARMMEGGEDPLFIARRLIEFASCDIGLADPQALTVAVSTFQATQFIGKPECEKPLAQCVIYLSRAPKSYEVLIAYSKAKASVVDQTGPLPSIPLHLRNASTKLMKSLGYGKGYSHDPECKMNFFPDSMKGTDFFV